MPDSIGIDTILGDVRFTFNAAISHRGQQSRESKMIRYFAIGTARHEYRLSINLGFCPLYYCNERGLAVLQIGWLLFECADRYTLVSE